MERSIRGFRARRAAGRSTMGESPAAPVAAATSTTRGPWLILAVVCLGMLNASVDGAAINVAYPLLAATFETSAAGIGWVPIAMMVTQIPSLAIFGRLADVVGRKRVYVGGIVV